MADSKKKAPKTGMWNCTVVATKEDKVYHASTANILEQKGLITVNSEVKKYVPKKAKE